MGIYEDTPKTEQSKRIIKIPTPVMELLKAYKKEQAKIRLQRGSHWHNTGFLFTQDNGKPMHPDTLTGFCKKFENHYNQLIQKENLSTLSEQLLIPLGISFTSGVQLSSARWVNLSNTPLS